MLGFQAHQQAVQAPDHHGRLGFTHMPLSHLPSLVEGSFLPFPEDPGQCETIYEETGVHHMAALGTGFCLLHGLGPQQTLYPHALGSRYGTSLSVG